MMQRILRDMYIEPELLAEVNEEQKQILFFKICEEQVRRWNERENREPRPRRSEKSDRRGIRWLLGLDGEVWVCVMGKAPGDRPFQDIVEELMEKRTRRQAQQEAKELWRVKEAEIEKKFQGAMAKEKARCVAGRRGEETGGRKAAKQEEEEEEEEECIREVLKKCEAEERQRGEEEIRCMEEKRAKELYISLKQEDKMGKRDDKEWKEQLLRSKTADEEMKCEARRARDECKRQSLRAIEKGLVAGLSGLFQKTRQNGTAHSRRYSSVVDPPAQTASAAVSTNAGLSAPPAAVRPASGPAPAPQPRRQTRQHSIPATLTDSSVWVRPPRPTSRESVLRWFREEQIPRLAGYERNSTSIAPWFHGIMSRQESESVLMKAPEGSFLVRVSKRIWGYTLSYRTICGFKHFLVDASGDYYSFLGVDQSRHAMLADLIDFHREEVITTSGGELLKDFCQSRSNLSNCGGLF